MRNADYAAAHGGRWIVVHPAHALNRPRPKTIGQLSPMFFKDPWSGRSPDAGVLVIEQARVYGTRGIVGHGDVYLPDCSFYNDERSLGHAWPYIKSWTPPVTRLAGTTLALVSNWADDNYFHFLVDSCARLALFFGAGFSFDDVDHVYLPSLDSPALRLVVERLGIPAQKIVRTHAVPAADCERLIAPSFPGASNSTPDWAVQFLRERIVRLAPDAPATPPLFVSRRGASRNLACAAELEAWVTQQGFEIIVPGRSIDDIDRFATARAIVGVFGAGMTNILFARAGTPVLEIMPPYYQTSALYSLAAGAQLDYTAYCPPYAPLRYSYARYQQFRMKDFDLPLEALQEAIQSIGLT
jgi:hypothetical protein